MRKKSWLCIFLAAAMIFGFAFAGCGGNKDGDKDDNSEYTVSFDVGSDASAAGVKTPESQKVAKGGTVIQPTIDKWEGHVLENWYYGTDVWNFSTDTVKSDMTLKADWQIDISAEIAREYEENLNWGEADHLYIHYLRGAHKSSENGTVNTAAKPTYSNQIVSEVYNDWGLWVWEYFPTNGEGRAFYPMKIDESGAVYDIDLTATYNDGGWNEATRNHKGLTIGYENALRLGIQVYSQDSRINGQGFWVNDGGDVYIILEEAKRENGDYHWFVRQGSVPDGSAIFTGATVYDPYEGLEEGSATTKYDVVSNKGNNDVYTQQPVAEGWEENSVGYQVFIASFADSNGDGMGDLRGVIEKLDYLEELGVDTLWLTPFQQSNSYHGYDIMDYFTVDPRFGTLDDYRELLFKAHQKGMKVLMDFVLNHTSVSNPWFAKSQSLVKETIKLPDGREKEIDYRNFYTWQNEEYVQSLKNPNAKAQWFKDSNGYYFYSSFGSSMPELNFDYQATRDAILEVALYWMSFGLDGFRLDAVKHIYMANESRDRSDLVVSDISASGDYSFDMNKDVHFFMEFNAKLKASYPNALLVGENFNGNPANLAPIYQGMDSQFDFNWYYDGTSSLTNIAHGQEAAATLLNKYAAAQALYAEYRTDYIDGIFTSNHDVQRARDRLFNQSGGLDRNSFTQADWDLSENLAKLWGGISLTLPGMTWIYNGDEIGM
ncbi:MAG: alpha-amylase family glycosyl hydrolase, partial [Ruminococcus flavefaciens]|nr:alpha-amylase family glycosyl hydrolase [Ruminococcus flavefaciens]